MPDDRPNQNHRWGGVDRLIRYPVAAWILDTVQRRRCASILKSYRRFLGSNSIVDVGAGTCHTTALLRSEGVTVTALDVRDRSLFRSVRPVIYDGVTIPFENDTFGTAILQTTLHHTLSPERLVEEAVRVARRLVIVEDVIEGPAHRRLTHAFDSLVNLEFSNHPHSNKTESEWMALFDSTGLRLIHRTARRKYGIIRQTTYVLERS